MTRTGSRTSSTRRWVFTLLGLTTIVGLLNLTGDGGNLARAAVCCDIYDLRFASFPVRGSLYESSSVTNMRDRVNELEAKLQAIGLLARPSQGGPLPGNGDSVIFDPTVFDLAVDLELGGNGPYRIESSFAPLFHVTGLSTNGNDGIWSTELLALEISGVASTSGGLVKVELRESPTLASLGMHSLKTEPDGTLTIDSFFDVFFEISLDGGPWREAETSTRLDLTALVPEPATIAMAIVGLVGCSLFLERKKGRRS